MPGILLLQGDLAASGPSRELAGWTTDAVCLEVLEHVDDEAGLLANVAACMRPGARLIVTVPGGASVGLRPPPRPSPPLQPGTGSGKPWKGPNSRWKQPSPQGFPPSTSTAWRC